MSLLRNTMSVAFLIGLATCPANAQQCDSWSQVAQGGLSTRSGHAMVYDSVREVTVLFGGQHPLSGETWEWDGASWRLVSTTGPSPREMHAMAFDSARRVTVLFGGCVRRDSEFGDTWEWDGAQWRQVATTGPTPRYSAAMAYDEARGEIVLFGGIKDFTTFGDTWTWNGSEWTQVASVGPRARGSHAMSYDPLREEVILFGGNADRMIASDTWRWDGEQWDLATFELPAQRASHAMVYDNVRSVTVLFGGESGVTRLSEMWEWDGDRWGIVPLIRPPMARTEHAMVFDVRRGRIVLFGGFGSNNRWLDDTWEYYCPTLHLGVQATCPGGGPITIEWSGATPRGRVGLLFGRTEGWTTIPAGSQCGGTQLFVRQGVRLVAEGTTGSGGHATILAEARRGACGGFMQLVDFTTCQTSNTARLD